jgi:hypothetical protein
MSDRTVTNQARPIQTAVITDTDQAHENVVQIEHGLIAGVIPS